MPLLSWAFTILPSYTPSVMVSNLYYLEHQCSPLDFLLSCMSNVMVSNIYFLQWLHWVGNKYMPSSWLCSHSHTLLPGEVVHTQFCHWRHTELYIVARSQVPLVFFLVINSKMQWGSLVTICYMMVCWACVEWGCFLAACQINIIFGLLKDNSKY